MQVTVIGAAGKTGKLVVQSALAAGHSVTAFVRDAADLAPAAGLQVVTGDATDLSAVSRAISGTDAVLDCVGGTTPYKATELERNVAGTILAAIREQSTQGSPAPRIIAISFMGIGDSKDQTPFWYEHLLMPTFLHGATPDKTAMEADIRTSGVPYVILRPPLLTDDPATGGVKVLAHGEIAHKVTRADLAQFMVQQVTSDTYLNQAIVVANS